MTAAVLISRLALAAVFAVSGLAKLADREGTRTAAVEFGAPARLAPALAWLLPAAELAVAVLLLPDATAVAGLVVAIALLVLFTAAIGVALARGRAPDCHCFGQLHSAPAGWKTLVRNGILIAVAVFALAGALRGDQASAVAWIGRLDGPWQVALGVGAGTLVLVAAAGAAFVSLLRSYGRVLVRLERLEAAVTGAGIVLEDEVELPEAGLEPGSDAPAFVAAGVHGSDVSLDGLLEPGNPVVLLFTSPSCGPCSALLPTVARWQREHGESLTVALAASGTAEAVRAEAEEFELDHVLVDEDSRLHAMYEASGTPGAVLITPERRIGSWVSAGAEAITRLVEQALVPPADSFAIPVGAEAPDLELERLDGGTFRLGELRGRPALLLFWSPSCGYCRAMHERLLEWEAGANGSAPRLVVVSSGDLEETRAEGFRSTVVLDETYAVGRRFGAEGTPMAVLIDGDGRVASAPAAGADAVFDLAAQRTRTVAR